MPQGVVLIAHSPEAQHLMDQLGIAWGVQYEIARGVSRGWWSWSDVTLPNLEKLRGQSKDAALKVPQVLSHSPSVAISQPDLQLWCVRHCVACLG